MTEKKMHPWDVQTDRFGSVPRGALDAKRAHDEALRIANSVEDPQTGLMISRSSLAARLKAERSEAQANRARAIQEVKADIRMLQLLRRDVSDEADAKFATLTETRKLTDSPVVQARTQLARSWALDTEKVHHLDIQIVQAQVVLADLKISRPEKEPRMALEHRPGGGFVHTAPTALPKTRAQRAAAARLLEGTAPTVTKTASRAGRRVSGLVAELNAGPARARAAVAGLSTAEREDLRRSLSFAAGKTKRSTLSLAEAQRRAQGLRAKGRRSGGSLAGCTASQLGILADQYRRRGMKHKKR